MDRFLAGVRRIVEELRERRVIRVAVVYAGTAFVILQLGEILVEPFDLPGWTLRLITLVLVLGFPLAVGLAWVFDVTEKGLVRTGREATSPENDSGGKPFTSDVVLIGLLVLVAGLLLYPRVFPSGEGTGRQGTVANANTTNVEERSIAVLPFEVSGERLGQVEVRGAPGSVTALTNELTREVLGVLLERSEEAIPSVDLESITTSSLEALKSFLEGARQERNGDVEAAIEAYEAAVLTDSTFALAYDRLSLARWFLWTGSMEGTLRALSRAHALSDRLPKRMQGAVHGRYLTLVEGRGLPRYLSRPASSSSRNSSRGFVPPCSRASSIDSRARAASVASSSFLSAFRSSIETSAATGLS